MRLKISILFAIAGLGLARPSLAGPAPPAGFSEAAAKAAVGLETLEPADAEAYCAPYKSLSAEQRREFWSAFLLDLADTESGLDSTRTRWSAFDSDAGRPTFRRGLLQISIESAQRPLYDCAVVDAGQLKDPEANLACGAKILKALIERDGVIAEPTEKGGARGGAAYWPTLAKTAPRHLLASRTSAIAVCAPAPNP